MYCWTVKSFGVVDMNDREKRCKIYSKPAKVGKLFSFLTSVTARKQCVKTCSRSVHNTVMTEFDIFDILHCCKIKAITIFR